KPDSIPTIRPAACRSGSYRLNRGAMRSITAPYAVHHRSGSTLRAAATAAFSLFHTSNECSPGGRALTGRNSHDHRPFSSKITIYGCSTSSLDVRVVLIYGEPTIFSSGNDVADFINPASDGGDRPALRFLRAISAAPQPVVAAVNGPAIGVGTTML